MLVKIYTDGASRNNPGKAGIGVVIFNENNEIIAQKFEYIGIATNNVAEYKAVIAGLELAENLGAKEVILFADSQLLVRQLNGEYRVKSEGLKPLYMDAKKILYKFTRVEIEHIPRKDNALADKLANKAIDEHLCQIKTTAGTAGENKEEVYMNKVEKALIHGLFVHLHHNIDKAIDFGEFKRLNEKVSKTWPGVLLVGPDANDDAGVVRIPGEDIFIVGKMESHNSPCVPRPYDAAATGAGGAMRDVVAMGGRPIFILDFIGTRPLEEKVLVGPCGFKGECTCGNCIEMTSQDRVNLMLKGIKDMCDVMDVFVAGGGFSTSFSDIVPACVVSVVGRLVTEKPLTKPAKFAGDKIIVIGETGTDGNDTLYRAGLVSELRPAVALFKEERITMEASIAAFKTGKINACSDLGAAGIGAAVCESARYGGFGAKVDLTNIPVNDKNITPEEILICETQGRMQMQVNPEDVEEVLAAIQSQNAKATVIGEITNDDRVVFEYKGEVIASIPNKPSDEILGELKKY